ncbi:sodium-translocating pyrophosphatase [Candidatus Peribacteria bacterium RIFCSPLOWO2_12_FULL_55_15]|nr:MAG: sodium-translocating pyrophosphatase [Candidatus Peribacteria bacterium RIFCSPHIGHO2_01_FULL_54_22]OGJ63187.1 MAG: sodium-translocating pyrophosphatase [Candidatus Peribacteria bacterium RIFCSPHIGHO2_02_FULL_55_24]OGJ64186.1 MAG: sodium-translocating pyrophosphatase [Candidatus Peribacteria bacterium RIFCSPHIGHO2_12_FULL_54_10]OGJ68536.1 MAG: sodium-translocating pyrophosphatase [Candidatus Peribacteria bacterium RIFCSPLOWO2_01_FULL_54_110]OGJ69150.1 MAG: sodium-translocating pyrophosph
MAQCSDFQSPFMVLSLFLELIAPVIALLCLSYAWVFWSGVSLAPDGGPAMIKVARAISIGAHAFIRRQYRTIAILTILVSALILAVYVWTGGEDGWRRGGEVAGSFMLGAVLSGVAGIVSMVVATRANIKTAQAAHGGLNAALQMALRGGAVPAIVITSLSLLGISGLYLFYRFGLDRPAAEIPALIVGYGFGASFVALFAQLGGGIYTKAADVGADIVGKIEAGIPEDDPRNPAVIADLVGDNVGDCAGRGADLFESISAENIGAMILGVALVPLFGLKGILFPLVLRAIGLVASIIGVYTVRVKEGELPMRALIRGYWVTAILTTFALYVTTRWMLAGPGDSSFWFFLSGLVGILTSVVFVYITDYYTGKQHRPVQAIAEASKTGHATNIIAGTAVGMESTGFTVITVCAALFSSYWCGIQTGIPSGGLYGTAVATIGMLSVVAYVLAMDMFGPITDNAGGIVEMSHAAESVRQVTDELDATGNTTKALTKGYAVGSAALAAFLLFSAYLEEAHLFSVDLARVEVFIGAFLGAMIVFLFSSFAIRAVGRAAGVIVEEVRRQFREKPGIMEGKEEPDYAVAVDIATRSALKEMVLPGLLAVVGPIVVGVLFRAEAVAGMLMVGTIAGVILAAYFNNSGGAWDNAKKYIEGGVYGGKRSFAHQAAVTGDTVGDPFKDTAGPSLHVLIKLFSTLTLALAALFI